MTLSEKLHSCRLASFALLLSPLPYALAQPLPRVLKARVVALDQPLMYNRLGASEPGGMIFALLRDVVDISDPNKPQSCVAAGVKCQPGKVALRASKRPRPMVLRMNEGDKLEIDFTNLLAAAPGTNAQTSTREAGIHVVGLQMASNISDDGSFAGANNSSLANPGGIKKYTLFAPKGSQGTYLLTSTAADIGGTGGGQISAGLFGAVNIQPAQAKWYRSQATNCDLLIAAQGQSTPDGHPLIKNYDIVYPGGSSCPDNTSIPPNTPVLNMLKNNELVYSDLTAIVIGPNPDATFPDNGSPLFAKNPASPDRTLPFREFTIIYHSDFDGNQAFPDFYQGGSQNASNATNSASDTFGINYGFAGIGSEIIANRLQVGPMKDCVQCKYEEFFLSSWNVGDPAMVVDTAADNGAYAPNGPAPPFNMALPSPGGKATKAYYPDDPSNVYHSYLNDHTKFRILSADSNLHHIHHQHAHQWLHTPNSDNSTYLDSQAIGPGSSFTLEMTYGGSGNRNRTPGDSIFHCHFYPHFAEGMWSLWRVHDVFEAGTKLAPNGLPDKDSRALPDAEILAGTPIPAVVPIPFIAMAPIPSAVHIENGQIVYGPTAAPDPDGKNVTANPGFPFFIPGRAGQRAPHPPMDFARNPANPAKELDGGLPRYVGLKGTATELHTAYNFGKELQKLEARQLDENGTNVEKIAIKFHANSSGFNTFLPNGGPGKFVVNGLGPQKGAPYADPCPVDPHIKDPNIPSNVQIYRAADIQTDVILNKKGWHYPQQRMITLWGDVFSTLFGEAGKGRKAAEPFFFRVNSGNCVEYWQTNLVPNYYELDNFQVRTPTDILGQHIHLVKFDVLASDGAANGFNYEDGTLSPMEVQEVITAINNAGGLQVSGAPPKQLTPEAPYFFCDDAAAHPDLCKVNVATPTASGTWVGAQTTIQRWWADPLLNNQNVDRTMRTVFTHDHFGPSTHQQTGLYAAMLIEPKASTWNVPAPDDPSQRVPGDSRVLHPLAGPAIKDGGPTSWQGDVIDNLHPDHRDSYREFAMAFQDLQLAYLSTSKNKPGGSPGNYTGNGNPDPAVLETFGWFARPAQDVVNPEIARGANDCQNIPPNPVTDVSCTTPQVVSAAFSTGTYSLNYRNEPLPFRLWDPAAQKQAPAPEGDASHAFRSIQRADSDLNKNPAFPAATGNFQYPRALEPGMESFDPFTPLLRAYQNDNVQVRLVAGSHLITHDFTIPGLKWLFEPSDTNSGFRNTQAMGISEHFEFLFQLPPAKGDVDYPYIADTTNLGYEHGIWGLLRSYDGANGAQKGLPFLPNNPTGKAPAGAPAGCPATAHQLPVVTVHAVNKQIDYNNRFGVVNPFGLVYLLDNQFTVFKNGGTVPNEPLILRANANDCLHIKLVNDLNPNKAIFAPGNAEPQFGVLGTPQQVFNGLNIFNYNIVLNPSTEVGLNPALVTFDAKTSSGMNAGKNPVQTVKPGESINYEWYAGNMKFDSVTNKYVGTPVEFGGVNLLPSDPMGHASAGLFGALVIEPKNSVVTTDAKTLASATVVVGANADAFREFVVMTPDRSSQYNNVQSGDPQVLNVNSAINYNSEPWPVRMGQDVASFGIRQYNSLDLSCGLSEHLITTLAAGATQAPPIAPVGHIETPIFTAARGGKIRFRVLNPGGVADQIFEVHGHQWQEEPYTLNSTKLGNNPLSQVLGARMGHGPTDRFDVLSIAGGTFGVPGDYVYLTHQSFSFLSGMWGVLRVGEPNRDTISLSGDYINKKLIGYDTVNPNTGQYAANVKVFANATCSGSPVKTINNLAASNGAWSVAFGNAANLCAKSNLGAIQKFAVQPAPPIACCTNSQCGLPAMLGQLRLIPAPRIGRDVASEKIRQMSPPDTLRGVHANFR